MPPAEPGAPRRSILVIIALSRNVILTALPIRYIWARHQRCEHLIDARIRTHITDSTATRTNRHTLGMDVICLTLAIPVGLRGTALVGLEVAQRPHSIHYTIISHNPTTRTPPLETLESPSLDGTLRV